MLSVAEKVTERSIYVNILLENNHEESTVFEELLYEALFCLIKRTGSQVIWGIAK